MIKNIPTGGHSTRTMAFDSNEAFYVQCGSGSNVDSDSRRAKIRTFDLTTIPNGGIDFSTGKVFADGLRNEVGLRWDSKGRLWGVRLSGLFVLTYEGRKWM